MSDLGCYMQLLRVRALVALVLLTGAPLPGCAAPQTSKPTRLVARERPLIRDVPQPIGFKIVEDVSEDALSGSRRLYVRHVYEGQADPYSVRGFYLEKMPHHRWHKVSEVSAKGVHTLRFEKGPESCTIKIERPASKRSVLRIHVLILQEDRGILNNKSRRSS